MGVSSSPFSDMIAVGRVRDPIYLLRPLRPFEAVGKLSRSYRSAEDT